MDHLNNNIPYFLGNWKILVLGVKLMEMNSNHCFNRHELQLWYPRMPVNLFRIPSGNCSFWRPRFVQIFKLQIFKREKATVIYTNQNPHRKKKSMNLRLLAREWQTTPSLAWKIPRGSFFTNFVRPSNASDESNRHGVRLSKRWFCLILQSSGRCSPPFGSVPPKGIWRLKWNKSCAGFTSSCSKRRRGNWVTNELMMFLFTHVCFSVAFCSLAL